MKVQSVEFLVGYAFGQLEKSHFKKLIGDKEKKHSVYNSDVQIPLCWFGGFPNRVEVDNIKQDLPGTKVVCEVVRTLEKTFTDIIDKKNFEFTIACGFIEKRYIKFELVVKRKPKKLTMKQLREIVGYDFVIDDSDKYPDIPGLFKWNNDEEDI